MKIVQAANFVAPRSGGIRTTLRNLSAGYTAAGHEVVQIIPAERDSIRYTPDATVITMRAPAVPGTNYRILTDPWRVIRVVEAQAPDRIEVHDRASLRPIGRWARRAGVGSLVVSHERLDRLLNQRTPQALRGVLPVRALADRSNRGLTRMFDTVVTTTGWAGAEFRRIGATNLRQIPLGVDLAGFHPDRCELSLRRAFARDSEMLLVHVGRLSPEKRPDTAIDALAELVRRKVPARLVIAGDGPIRGRLTRHASGLPVIFLGFVADRRRLASLLASADAVLAPGPVETFGLAALESMASGTAVVVHHDSALAELVTTGAGTVAAGCGFAFADGIQELLALDPMVRRRASRARAEGFPWSVTVDGFLATHGLPGAVPAPWSATPDTSGMSANSSSSDSDSSAARPRGSADRAA